jgi:uncharacterized protein (DUF1501 family)
MARDPSCDDCTRAQLLRATAGRGLPEIEPGMPAPAGTGLSRRSLLWRAAGLAVSVYGAGLVRPLPQALAGIGGPADRVLIQVYLEGGIDSVNVLAPTEDPAYRRLRPNLALPPGTGTPFGEDGRLRWHPSAESLAQLHGEGKLCVMPAVGYTHPDQSHFVSRHFYEVGALEPNQRVGWLGRYLDRVGAPDNPLQGLSLDGSLAPALATARVPVASIDSPAGYGFWARDVWGDVEQLMLQASADIGAAHMGGDAALRHAATGAVQAGRLRGQLAPFAPTEGGEGGEGGEGLPFSSPVPYPASEGLDSFPAKLAGVAAMLAAGLPLHCVSITAPGGYDTHSDQREVFDGELKLTCDSLLAFQRDLEARGLADRVLVHVWSEFGRRAEDNGSGTDHGAAGLGLVLGTRATGRMVGEFPGLDQLDPDGNLRATSDLRAVYASLLEQWLGHDAAAVLPDARAMARPALVR